MKIFCIGRNYADHAKELNNPVPKQPLVFMKPATALSNKDFLFIPDFTDDLHYEVEIVLKMAKNGKHIKPKFAPSYYTEISVGIDFTARDIQRKCKEKGHPWEIAKAFDSSAPVGEFVDISKFDINAIEFSLKKNGTVMQTGNTKDLIFKFDELVSHISKYFTIQLGDLIFTGTPAGVGSVQKGDKLECFIGQTKMLECNIK